MKRPAECAIPCLLQRFQMQFSVVGTAAASKPKTAAHLQHRTHLQHFLAAARSFRHRWQLASPPVSLSLALRAGVLRRAVSSTVRPLLHRRTSSGSVGRMPLRPSSATVASRSWPFVSAARSSQVGRYSALPPVRPNRSLNRTHCGMRPKALHFILGL